MYIASWTMSYLISMQAARWQQYASTMDPRPVVRLDLREKVETLLQEAFKWYPDHMLQARVRAAEMGGVSCNIAVLDGNMKLNGRICARAHAEVQHSPGLKMWLAHCCSAQPAFKKRRCSKHCESQPPEDPYPAQAEEVVGHRRSRRVHEGEAYDVLLRVVGRPEMEGRWAPASQATPTQLHEYWRQMESQGSSVPIQSSSADLHACRCKTHKELQDKKLKKLVRGGRANGWLFAVTPDGFCMHCRPFFGSESLSQRHFFLAELVAAFSEISIVVHDDSCHLRRYSSKHQARSELAARLAYPNIRYVLDRWHQSGHVDPWCRQHCWTDTEENEELLRGVNTSRAEAWNALMTRHRHVIRVMCHLTRSFFVNEVVDLRNAVALAEKRKDPHKGTCEGQQIQP